MLHPWYYLTSLCQCHMSLLNRRQICCDTFYRSSVLTHPNVRHDGRMTKYKQLNFTQTFSLRFNLFIYTLPGMTRH